MHSNRSNTYAHQSQDSGSARYHPPNSASQESRKKRSKKKHSGKLPPPKIPIVEPSFAQHNFRGQDQQQQQMQYGQVLMMGPQGQPMYQTLIYAPVPGVPAHQPNQESFNNESFPEMMIVNPQQMQ